MSTASDLIEDARGYASTQLTNAQIQMNAAMNILSGLSARGPGKFDLKMEPPKPYDPKGAPQYKGSSFRDPGLRATEPTFQDPGDLSEAGQPGDAPPVAQYYPPPQPQGEPTDTTGDPPPINDVTDVPPPPDLLAEIASIPVPVLIPVTFPDKPPVYVPPEFAGQPPTAPPPPPSNLEDTMRGEWSEISVIMVDAVTAQIDAFIDREFPNHRNGLQKIEERLFRYLEGGSALSPEVETALYNRLLDKTNMETTRASRKAWGEAGRMGFTLPNPILVAQQYDIDQQRRDTNARAAIDITVKQAELEQSNLQFAVTQSSMLRKLAIDSGLAYYNGLVTINGQALDYARSLVDAIVKSYDLAVKYCEIQARIYETEARIYEAHLKGAMAGIEAYVMMLKALEIKTQSDIAQVQLYTERINAVNAEANVYRAYIEGIKAEAEIERMKIEIYTAEVGAYVAKMNGYSARWQGYSAAVGGESAKMNASAVEQQAWSAKWAAYDSTIRGRTAALQGKLAVEEGRLKSYQAAVEAYNAHVQALAAVNRAEVDSFDSTIKAYQAEASARSAGASSELANYEAGLRAADVASQVLQAELREQNAVTMQKIISMAAVATAAGNIYSASASASLSGMNSLASVAAEDE
jgi:hypothetical protein